MNESHRARRSKDHTPQPCDQEWERDALVWLVGQVGEPTLPTDVSDPIYSRAQECFWEWRGRQASRQQAVHERRRTLEVAEQMVSQFAALSKPAPVRCVDHAPTQIRPLISGSAAKVLEHARRVGAAPLVELGVAAGSGRTLWDEPTESWVVVPTAPGVPDHKYVALRIVGDSMVPLLHSGDVVLVDLEGEAQPGAIIVARSVDDGGGADGYLVKRVSNVAGGTLELSSLNPAYPGTTIPRDRGHVLGRVVLRWANGPVRRTSKTESHG